MTRSIIEVHPKIRVEVVLGTNIDLLELIAINEKIKPLLISHKRSQLVGKVPSTMTKRKRGEMFRGMLMELARLHYEEGVCWDELYAMYPDHTPKTVRTYAQRGRQLLSQQTAKEAEIRGRNTDLDNVREMLKQEKKQNERNI